MVIVETVPSYYSDAVNRVTLNCWNVAENQRTEKKTGGEDEAYTKKQPNDGWEVCFVKMNLFGSNYRYV